MLLHRYSLFLCRWLNFHAIVCSHVNTILMQGAKNRFAATFLHISLPESIRTNPVHQIIFMMMNMDALGFWWKKINGFAMCQTSIVTMFLA